MVGSSTFGSNLVFAAPLLRSKLTKKIVLSESGECVTSTNEQLIQSGEYVTSTHEQLFQSGECVTSTHEQLFQCLQFLNNATIIKIKDLFPQAWVTLDDFGDPV